MRGTVIDASGSACTVPDGAAGSLPPGVGEAAQLYWPAFDDVAEHGNDIASRPLRLLLAEPVAGLRNSMVKILSRRSYEILTATDGFEVLCRLPEWRPDVLLMASELPRLSGLDVCRLLRESPDFCVLPVLMLVNDDPFLETARARDVGANACLRRPFRLAELIAALTRISEQQCDDVHLATPVPGQPECVQGQA